jgi:hypothetical protein
MRSKVQRAIMRTEIYEKERSAKVLWPREDSD